MPKKHQINITVLRRVINFKCRKFPWQGAQAIVDSFPSKFGCNFVVVPVCLIIIIDCNKTVATSPTIYLRLLY